MHVVFLANIVLFLSNIIIDRQGKVQYSKYRLDHGSQVCNSNSEEFPFYTAKTPKVLSFGVFAVTVYFSSLYCFTINKLISKAMI